MHITSCSVLCNLLYVMGGVQVKNQNVVVEPIETESY